MSACCSLENQDVRILLIVAMRVTLIKIYVYILYIFIYNKHAPLFSPGQKTHWRSIKEKEFTVKAKLTEKNLLALEKSEKLDGDLGLATPSSIMAMEDSSVKLEMPSLQKLTELSKTGKIS